MTKLPVSNHNTTSDNLQTWILRVYIHCEGCKKKVFKILQSIDGVYKTEIDSNQHKAAVTGSVNGDTLVQKLLKSGKHAEILPESFETKPASDNPSGNPKNKKKQNKKQPIDDVKTDNTEHIDDKKEESRDAITDKNDGRNDQEIADPALTDDNNNNNNNSKGNDNNGGGKKKKNKKKKGDKNDEKMPPTDETDGLPMENLATENVGDSVEQLNLSHPNNQMMYVTPYDIPPYPNYYPTPAHGVSYSTNYPCAESSYYTPPVYGYAQSNPSVFYPPPPPPSYYRRSALDDHDDEAVGSVCAIM